MTKIKLRTAISNVLNEYGIGPEYDHLRSEKDNLTDEDMEAIAERFCNFLVKQEFPYVDFVKAHYRKNDRTFKGGETIVVRAIVRSNEWKRERIEDTDMRGRKRVRYSDVPVYFFKHGFRGINLDKLFAGTKYLRNMKPHLDSDSSSQTRERYWFKMLLFWPKYHDPEKRKLVFQELKEWLDANENKTFSRDDFGFPPIKEEYLNEGKGSTMKISKRQLKRIIREEYTRLKRKGLLKEAIALDDIEVLCSMMERTEEMGDWRDYSDHYENMMMDFKMSYDEEADHFLDVNNLHECPPTASLLCDALRDPRVNNHPLFTPYFNMLYGV